MPDDRPIYEVHPEVYHYSSFFGVRGILDSQTLWATHFQYLNDSTEALQLRERLVEIARAIFEDEIRRLGEEDPRAAAHIEKLRGTSRISEKASKAMVSSLYDVTLGTPSRQFPAFATPFITSFCTHSDDYEIRNGGLYQWTTYAKGGCALVFDTKRLADLMGMENHVFLYSWVSMGDVVYDGDDDGFSTEFSELISKIRGMVVEAVETEAFSSREVFDPLVGSLSRFKHRAFQIEREVRIVVSPQKEEFIQAVEERSGEKVDRRGRAIKEVKKRGDNGAVPYVELFATLSKRRRLPIKRIIVGPNKNQDLVVRMVKERVRRRGIEIIRSETPLVER